MEKVKYLYGVIEADEERRFGPIGFSGQEEEAYAIPHQGLGIVASDSPPLALDTLPKEEIVRYLFAHQKAIEKVMEECSILPIKFGTFVRSAQEARKTLEKGYSKLKEALKAMEDKIELDMVVSWNKDLVYKDISQEEEIKKFKQELSQEPSQEEKAKLGQMVEASLNKRKERLAPEITGVLSEVAEDSCAHETADATMILNTAFLIRKDRQESFDQKMEELDKKYEDHLKFRRVGPLPPYSFSTVEVKKVEFEEMDKARKLLGLGEEVTPSQIKEAYWDLASRYHPDKQPSDEKKYEEISKAYELLSEYCVGERCSFQEVEDFIKVDIVRVGR